MQVLLLLVGRCVACPPGQGERFRVWAALAGGRAVFYLSCMPNERRKMDVDWRGANLYRVRLKSRVRCQVKAATRTTVGDGDVAPNVRGQDSLKYLTTLLAYGTLA